MLKQSHEHGTWSAHRHGDTVPNGSQRLGQVKTVGGPTRRSFETCRNSCNLRLFSCMRCQYTACAGSWQHFHSLFWHEPPTGVLFDVCCCAADLKGQADQAAKLGEKLAQGPLADIAKGLSTIMEPVTQGLEVSCSEAA